MGCFHWNPKDDIWKTPVGRDSADLRGDYWCSGPDLTNMIWADVDLSCRWQGIGGSTAYKYKHQFVASGAHTCGYLFGYGVLLSGVLCSRCLGWNKGVLVECANPQEKTVNCQQLNHSVSKGKMLKKFHCFLGLGPISARVRIIIKKGGSIRTMYKMIWLFLSLDRNKIRSLMAKFLMGNAFLMGRSVSKWAGQYNFPISPARSSHIAISEHVVKLCPC